MRWTSWLGNVLRNRWDGESLESGTTTAPSRRQIRGSSEVSPIKALPRDYGINTMNPDDSGISLDAPEITPKRNGRDSLERMADHQQTKEERFDISNDLELHAREHFLLVGGDLSDRINKFMGEYVLGANNINYRNVSGTISYLQELALGADSSSLASIETATTLLSHLKDYSQKRERKQKKSTSKGFTGYLIGKNGVLTQKRLSDLQKAKKRFSSLAKSRGLKEGTKYKMSAELIGGSSEDTFNISYTKSNSPRGNNVHIDYNNSRSMDGIYGSIDKNGLDAMLEHAHGRKVDSFKLVTKSINGYIDDQVKSRRAERINGGFARFTAA